MSPDNEERLRQLYRDEGWGLLAEAAGLDPIHTESQARVALTVAYSIIEDKDLQIQRLREHLVAVRDAGVLQEGTALHGRVVCALPGDM